jgi:hypothetical protein
MYANQLLLSNWFNENRSPPIMYEYVSFRESRAVVKWNGPESIIHNPLWQHMVTTGGERGNSYLVDYSINNGLLPKEGAQVTNPG